MCPFCKSENCIHVENSVGQHWMFCGDCKAAGPQAADEESARAAWANVQPQARPGVIARLLGKGGES